MLLYLTLSDHLTPCFHAVSLLLCEPLNSAPRRTEWVIAELLEYSPDTCLEAR